MQFKAKVIRIRIWQLIAFVFLLVNSSTFFAQTFTQTVKGRVVDEDTKAPIFGAKIVILNLTPTKGTTSDLYGFFTLEKVPIGRYDFKIS